VINDEANISLLIPHDRLPLIADSKFWYGFVDEEPIDVEFCRLRFANSELKGFATWIISSGSYARVEEPTELKEILDRFISGIIEHYTK